LIVEAIRETKSRVAIDTWNLVEDERLPDAWTCSVTRTLFTDLALKVGSMYVSFRLARLE
jgi:hypothetical protein